MTERTETEASPMGGSVEPWMFEVIDLKQYAYCPRVVYYRYCLPLLRPTTYKMEAGIAAHTLEAERESRRSLASYGLDEGERHFDVRLASPELGLSGRMDFVIVLQGPSGREAIPVDYKNAREVRPNWRRQLAAYALLLEEAWALPVRRGFVYMIPTRRAAELSLTAREKGTVRRIVEEMRGMVAGERVLEPTSQRRRCVDCEFRRFCNDVF